MGVLGLKFIVRGEGSAGREEVLGRRGLEGAGILRDRVIPYFIIEKCLQIVLSIWQVM